MKRALQGGRQNLSLGTFRGRFSRELNPEPQRGEGPRSEMPLSAFGGPGRIRTYNQQIMSLLL